MCYSGLFKRIIPFALTFAVGLFLASFFVSIALPCAGWRDERRMNRANEFKQLRMDYERLQEKYRSVQRENEELRKRASDWDDGFMEDAVPPVDLETHHPPAPPRPPKEPRLRIER